MEELNATKGYGYAGTRFLRALRYLRTVSPNLITEIAICDRRVTDINDLPQYRNLEQAIIDFNSNIAVVTTNECEHFAILKILENSKVKIILCEKPLVETLEQANQCAEMFNTKLLSVNLVERYSDIVSEFAKWNKSNPDYEVKRVEFFWGKNRVKDLRPTIGVISEIIHSIDLI